MIMIANIGAIGLLLSMFLFLVSGISEVVLGIAADGLFLFSIRLALCSAAAMFLWGIGLLLGLWEVK